jgi:hypothetical protein
LTLLSDDGIVVRMEQTMSTSEYLRTDETTAPRELAFGIVREPPAPFFTHQEVVLRTGRGSLPRTPKRTGSAA